MMKSRVSEVIILHGDSYLSCPCQHKYIFSALSTLTYESAFYLTNFPPGRIFRTFPYAQGKARSIMGVGLIGICNYSGFIKHLR
jgi:hypothetical protein